MMRYWPSMSWINSSKEGIRDLPVPLWAVGGFAFGIIVGLFLAPSHTWATSLIGLVGVVIGGLISAVISLLSAREARRGQIIMATWPKRVSAHQEAFSHLQNLFATWNSSSEERHVTIDKSRKWYLDNCLYLADNVRTRFLQILFRVEIDWSFPSHRENNEAMSYDANLFQETYLLIFEASGASITDEELRRLLPARDEELRRRLPARENGKR